jgi:hypothetical protein
MDTVLQKQLKTAAEAPRKTFPANNTSTKNAKLKNDKGFVNPSLLQVHLSVYRSVNSCHNP